MSDLMGPHPPTAEMESDETLEGMLLRSMQESLVSPDPSSYQEQMIELNRIKREMDSLDQKDQRSKGILGFFGRRSRDKKRQDLIPQLEQEQMDVSSAKSDYDSRMGYYQRGQDRQDDVFKAMLGEQFKDTRTSKMKEADDLGLEGDSRQQYYSAPSTMIDMSSRTIPDAFLQSGAEMYQSMQTQLATFPELEMRMGEMEKISQAVETGRTQDAMAMMGAWFGTDAGSARDVWRAQAVPLMLNMAEAIKGPMTEREWDMLRSALPSFGQDQKATSEVMRIMRKAMSATTANFDSATSWLNENRSLIGWKPPAAIFEHAQEASPAEGSFSQQQLIQFAKEAIERGADPVEVEKMMQEMINK